MTIILLILIVYCIPIVVCLIFVIKHLREEYNKGNDIMVGDILILLLSIVPILNFVAAMSMFADYYDTELQHKVIFSQKSKK